MLQSICPGEFKYVGDNGFILGKKCPDFKHVNKKKLIEIFGDFWHKEEDAEKKINYFKKYGYECLVIWESEIKKDLAGVTKRVLMFVGRDLQEK